MLDLNPDNVSESLSKVSSAFQELSDRVQALEDQKPSDSKATAPVDAASAKGQESKPSDLKGLV